MKNLSHVPLIFIVALFLPAQLFAQAPAEPADGSTAVEKPAEKPAQPSGDPLQDLLNELDNSGDSLENVLENANKKLEEDREQVELMTPEKVMELLKQVVEKMDVAGELILEAQNWDAAKNQDEVVGLIKKLLEQAEASQDMSVENANKILDYSKESQGSAVKKLEKIIEIIKKNSPSDGSGEPCSCGKCEECLKRKKEMEKRQKTPQQNNPQKPNNPAEKPYVVPPSTPPENRSPFNPGESTGWGWLPAKLRDELEQSGTKEKIPEYKDKIEEYYKILGSEEEK